jgi:hypothetical protein
METVDIYINGVNVAPYVKSYSLRYSLFGSTASFEAEIMHTLNGILLMKDEGVLYQVAINGTPVQIGRLDTVERSFSKDAVSLKIAGRDIMQVLTDNSILYPRTYTNFTVKQIISAIWAENRVVTGPLKAKAYTEAPVPSVGPPSYRELSSATTQQSIGPNVSTLSQYGAVLSNQPTIQLYPLELKYTGQVSQMLDDFGKVPVYKTTYGQTLFMAMTDILNPMGIISYVIPGTETVLFTKAINPGDEIVSGVVAQYLDSLIKPEARPQYFEFNIALAKKSGNNVISGTTKIDVSSYAKYLKIVGQTQDELSGKQMDSGGTGTMSEVKNNLLYEQLESGSLTKGYQGFLKVRVGEITVPSLAQWQKNSQYMVDNFFLGQNRSLFNARYTVAGHTNADLSNKNPYMINQVATVTDDLSGLDKVTMLIYGVEFKGSKDQGQTTDVELCLPSTLPEGTIANAKLITLLDQFVKTEAGQNLNVDPNVIRRAVNNGSI